MHNASEMDKAVVRDKQKQTMRFEVRKSRYNAFASFDVPIQYPTSKKRFKGR
jgi:hypothetical protein